MPKIEQLHLLRPAGLDDDEAELRAYRARKRIERETTGAYVCSLSFRTVTYKGLVGADLLGDFYLDLHDREIEVPFGVFHQRFATNTTPTWERAQPFRFLCHNGEINAVAGNVNWMRAREARLGTLDDSVLAPVIEEPDADSRCSTTRSSCSSARRRRDVAPRARDAHPARRGRATPSSTTTSATSTATTPALVEPWDGPAGLVFTDGRVVGAGARPQRPAAAALRDRRRRARRLLVRGGRRRHCTRASKVKRGKLGPGQMLAVDPSKGGSRRTSTIKQWLAQQLPVRALARGQPATRGSTRRARRGAGRTTSPRGTSSTATRARS